MDFKNETVNNLFLRDVKISSQAARKIVDNTDIKAFSILCENSSNIFDFLLEKINKMLLNSVNSANFKNIFTFTKKYCAEFEDFIVGALVKFANEDLTDEILEKFNEGTDDEKCYFARYFYFVCDTVALDMLNKCAMCDNPDLQAICAKTLSKFNDRKIYNEAIEKLKSSNDEFEKIKCAQFLSNYNDKSATFEMLEFMKKTSFENEVAILILNLKSLKEMVKDNEDDSAKQVFDRVLASFPEMLPLNSLYFYEIFDFIKYLAKKDDSYSKRLLLSAKIKFEMFKNEDIYTFDLEKDEKAHVFEICNFLHSIKNSDANLTNELFSKDFYRISQTLDLISECKFINYTQDVEKLLNDCKNQTIKCACVRTLKELGSLPKNKAEILDGITDENLHALTNSYFC